MRIALLSDTHIPQRLARLPAKLVTELAEVDAIIHAGDFADLAVLRGLRRLATTYGVHGNCDPPELQRQLPRDLTLTIAGHRIGVTHGHDKGQPVQPRTLLLSEQGRRSPEVLRYLGYLVGIFPQEEVIIFGHYHAPFVKRHDGRLFINPGSVAADPDRSTFAMLEIGPPPEEPHAEIVWLD